MIKLKVIQWIKSRELLKLPFKNMDKLIDIKMALTWTPMPIEWINIKWYQLFDKTIYKLLFLDLAADVVATYKLYYAD